MARLPAHITSRSGIYIYRRRVPDDVRASQFFGGKSHYQVSLRTSDPNEAKARALPLGIRFEAEVQILRQGSLKAKVLRPGQDRVLSEEALEAIQAGWFAAGQKRDRERRAMAEAAPDGEWAHHLDGEDDHLHHLIAELNDPVVGRERLRTLRQSLRIEWSSFIALEARRWAVAPGTDDYLRIERAIVDAQIDVLRASHMGWGGHNQEPTSPAVVRGLTRNLKPQSSWTITQLASEVLATHPKRASWHHKVQEQVVPLFVSHLMAPKPISDIKPADIRSFIDQLRQCPTNAAQRFPGLSLAEAIDANRRRTKPFPTLSANTIRDTHYAVLRSLFSYAVSQEWLVASPADKLKVVGSTKRGGRRPSFKVEELQRLFQLPVFTGCKSSEHYGAPGSVKLDDHRFWTPLIMLYTGARPSEIGQLALSDIKLDDRIPFISILTEFDPDDPDDKPFYVTCKTDNARREVPIHPALMELGFATYVESIRSEGHVRLFPHWKKASDARKLYSGARWIRRFNEVFIPACTERYPRPTFYSLRHTFKVALATHGIYAAIQNQMLGHANAGMDAHYFDEVPLEDLYEQIARVTYRHLDLSHLKGRVAAVQ